MKRPKISPIILGTAILIVIVLILIINLEQATTYGTIKKKGNAFISKTEIINCQAVNKNLKIINPGSAGLHIDETLTINGLKLFNCLIIQSFNSSYNPKSECFSLHENDVVSEIQNYTITADESNLIEYTITNYADNRLFHEARLISDCTVEQDTYTDYLDPGQTQNVFFNITCSQGVHESTIEIVFIDELTNQHSDSKEIVINSSIKS